MSVFNDFEEVDFEFLELETGALEGNTVKAKTTHKGIFKSRQSLNVGSNEYNPASRATLHVHPGEFEHMRLVGHGVRYLGNDYLIVDCVAGVDFDSNSLEFYKLTLERANLHES